MVIFYNLLYVCQRILGVLGKSWDDRIHFTDMPVLFLRNCEETHTALESHISYTYIYNYIYIYIYLYLDAKPMTFSTVVFP